MYEATDMREAFVPFRHAVSDGGVLSKAALRAAERLDLSSTALAKILGLSSPTITRMRQGAYTIERNDKAFELAALFVRLYRSLDAIVGGDDAVAAAWLKNENTALQDKPANLIQKVTGLIDVLHYLDARRALS
jgi:transcriptional regulator with XRE-family HTH domain